jgi:VIT1/CCC1 family predicted Fe2+/Mn2+ transporter
LILIDILNIGIEEHYMWQFEHAQTSICASISALAWMGMFLAKGSGNLFLGNCLGIIYHLALAPVIAILPAIEWVRMAGYIWIFSDAVIDVASINKLSEENVWSLRMGVHIPAAVWIVGSSAKLSTLPMAVGIILGVLLGIHAIVGPYIPKPKEVLFAFVFPLMTVWLGSIAFTFY